MVLCAVVGCSSRSMRDSVSFYRIPAILTQGTNALNDLSHKRRDAWISAIKRADFHIKNAKHERVCSKHFISGRPSSLEDVLNPDWAPSQNVGYHKGSKLKLQAVVERHNRLKKRLAIELPETSAAIEDTNDDTDTLTEDMIVIEVENDSTNSKECQTDIFGADIEKNSQALQNCNAMIYDLREKLNALTFSKETFIGDDEKTNYFTGLPTAKHLFILFDKIEKFLPSHQNRALTQFEMFLIVLMKMRLNFPFKYMAYRFNVAPCTLSDNFHVCLNVMFERLKPLVAWPDKDSLRKTMPATFREAFGDKIAVILNYFEVLTEKPSDPLKSAQLWSTYKHHHTVKFLIGIAPQGAISFISKAWGGRTSDKFLTEKCGILDKLLSGDVVMADRGFLISDEVRMRKADLVIPAFTKGKTQLDPIDVEITPSIAHVRKHVEMVIGLLKKKYTLFRGPIPVSMLEKSGSEYTVIDQMVHVAASLINICETPVPVS